MTSAGQPRCDRQDRRSDVQSKTRNLEVGGKGDEGGVQGRGHWSISAFTMLWAHDFLLQAVWTRRARDEGQTVIL